MSNELDNETQEDYIRRLAKQRWEMRMHFRWRLEDTADDDWNYAKRSVEEEMRRKQCL